MDRCLGKREFAEEVVQEFLDTVDGYIEGIQSAFDNDDESRIEQELHQLKGVSGNLSATTVFQLAQEMLALTREGQAAVSKERLPELNKQIQKTIPVLQEFL